MAQILLVLKCVDGSLIVQCDNLGNIDLIDLQEKILTA